MKVKWYYKRYFLFVAICLIVVPLIFSLMMEENGLYNRIRTVFLLQKFHIVFTALFFIFIMIASRKLENFQPRKRKIDEIIPWGFLAITFFALAMLSQTNFDKIILEGVGTNGQVNFDSERWLAPNFLSDHDYNKDFSIMINDNAGGVKLIFNISKVPDNPVLVWNSKWVSLSGKNTSDCKVWFTINNHSVDVSEQYRKIPPDKKYWMKIDLDKSFVHEGSNELVLSKQCREAIGITSQGTYTARKVFELYDTKWTAKSYNDPLIAIAEKNSNSFKILFKLGFIFRVLAFISLIILIFGLDFVYYILKNAKLELFFSFIYALAAFWFTWFIYDYWKYLSYAVSYAVYILLKISFMNPVLKIGTSNPIVGPEGFVLGIAAPCSGIESLSYFILTYFVIIAFKWRELNVKRALLMIIPGLFGTFLMNALRLYLIMVIGKIGYKEFAINTFHTHAGLILFVVYFLVFWHFVSKYILKKPSIVLNISKQRQATKRKKKRRVKS